MLRKAKRAADPVLMPALTAGFVLVASCGGEVLPLQGPAPGSGGSAGSEQTGATGGSFVTGGTGGSARAGSSGDDGGEAGASTGGSVTGPGPSAVGLEGAPVYTRLMRLTPPQWERAVTDILRLEQRASLGMSLIPDGSTDFTNNEKLLLVTPPEVIDFEAGAEAAVAAATGRTDGLARVSAETDPLGFIRAVGRRAFRRPLTAEEEARYEGIFAAGEAIYGDGFENGAALVLRALLQSPSFLYRSELGPDGEPLVGHEVASKLSFWLLGTTPSDELLDAALAGELDTADGLESAARAMLEEPLALEVMRDFHGQLHRLAALATLEKPGVPEYSSASNPELQQAAFSFFDTIFARGEGLREILTKRRAFVGPALAPLYGMNDAPSALEERELDASRAGYFMQVPFLMLHGVDREPNTVVRGSVLARDVLCVTLLPPPAESPPLPAQAPGQTNRQRIEAETACGATCHGYIDPLGFALEAFDGMGRYREEDNGSPVDTAASYPFADGTQSFSTGQELMQILAGGVQAHTCYAKKLSGYALQRDIVEDDRPLLESLAVVSREESLKEMIIELVRDPAFRLRKEAP